MSNLRHQSKIVSELDFVLSQLTHCVVIKKNTNRKAVGQAPHAGNGLAGVAHALKSAGGRIQRQITCNDGMWGRTHRIVEVAWPPIRGFDDDGESSDTRLRCAGP